MNWLPSKAASTAFQMELQQHLTLACSGGRALLPVNKPQTIWFKILNKQQFTKTTCFSWCFQITFGAQSDSATEESEESQGHRVSVSTAGQCSHRHHQFTPAQASRCLRQAGLVSSGTSGPPRCISGLLRWPCAPVTGSRLSNPLVSQLERFFLPLSYSGFSWFHTFEERLQTSVYSLGCLYFLWDGWICEIFHLVGQHKGILVWRKSPHWYILHHWRRIWPACYYELLVLYFFKPGNYFTCPCPGPMVNHDAPQCLTNSWQSQSNVERNIRCCSLLFF